LTTHGRYRLLPYIIQQAEDGAKVGLPLVRAMVLEYPNDPTTWHLETQYFLGHDLLLAPTLQPLEELAKQPVYLPAGTWYDFWTKDKVVSHGSWFFWEPATVDSMLMWVRAGARIPLARKRRRTWNHVGEVESVQEFGVSE